MTLKLVNERTVRHRKNDRKKEREQFFHRVPYGEMLSDRDTPFGARLFSWLAELVLNIKELE